LKQRTRERFAQRNLDHRLDEYRIAESIGILIESWESITQEQVPSAWDHFRDPEEQITGTEKDCDSKRGEKKHSQEPKMKGKCEETQMATENEEQVHRD
jgi:hypothetical protein